MMEDDFDYSDELYEQQEYEQEIRLQQAIEEQLEPLDA